MIWIPSSLAFWIPELKLESGSFVWSSVFQSFFLVSCLTYIARILFHPYCLQVVRWCYYWRDHTQADWGSAQYLHLQQGLGRDGGAAGGREAKHCHREALHCWTNLAGAFPSKPRSLGFLALLPAIVLLAQLVSVVLFFLSLSSGI